MQPYAIKRARARARRCRLGNFGWVFNICLRNFLSNATQVVDVGGELSNSLEIYANCAMAMPAEYLGKNLIDDVLPSSEHRFWKFFEIKGKEAVKRVEDVGRNQFVILEYAKGWKGETPEEQLSLAAVARSTPAGGRLTPENNVEIDGWVSVVHGTLVSNLLKIFEGVDDKEDVIKIPMIESESSSGDYGVFVADRYALSLNSYAPSSQGMKVCLVFWVY